MTDTVLKHAPKHLWIIGVIALLWNLMGVANFIGQLNSEFVASMPESHRALIEGRALWATLAFAIAVFGGAMGCILLLMRRELAIPVFLASLAGVIVQLIPSIQVATTTHSFTTFEILLAFCGPVIVGIFLYWYARWCRGNGCLRPF